MAIFRVGPEKQLQSARSNRDRLAVRLADAETAVIASKTSAQKLALDGDDTGLDKAEAAGRAARDRHATIAAALAAAEQHLAVLENAQVEAADRKVRRETAAAIEQLATEYEQAIGPYAAAAAVLADLSTRSSLLIFESRGLEAFFQSSKIEVAAAVEVVAASLRAHAASVVRGEAAAAMPIPEQPYVAPVLVKPVTRRLFSLRPVSWTDHDGQLRVAQRWNDVDLPLACADRAIAANACVEMDNAARTTKTLRQWPGHPNPANCFNLDAPGAAGNADTTEPQRESDEVHSAFQPLDRGQPYQLRVAR